MPKLEVIPVVTPNYIMLHKSLIFEDGSVIKHEILFDEKRLLHPCLECCAKTCVV